MYKLSEKDGNVSIEEITVEDALNEEFITGSFVVTDGVADIIIHLMEKNYNLAQRIAQGSVLIGSQLKGAMRIAYHEGAQAQRDVAFEEQIQGVPVELPDPYGASGL